MTTQANGPQCPHEPSGVVDFATDIGSRLDDPDQVAEKEAADTQHAVDKTASKPGRPRRGRGRSLNGDRADGRTLKRGKSGAHRPGEEDGSTRPVGMDGSG